MPNARYYFFFLFFFFLLSDWRPVTRPPRRRSYREREGARFCASRPADGSPSAPQPLQPPRPDATRCNQKKTDYRDIFILETSDIIDRLFI